jgi:transcriptional regulator with AAA-type ATPase domain
MHDFPGMIAAADGGTLFLDEISDMPADCRRGSCACCKSASIGRLAAHKQ